MLLMPDLTWHDVQAINHLIGWAAEGVDEPMQEPELSLAWMLASSSFPAASRNLLHPAQLVAQSMLREPALCIQQLQWK